MGVSTGRVEVGDPVVGLVGDVDGLQILLDHQPSLLLCEIWKEWRVRLSIVEPFVKSFDQLRMQRQDVFPAVLGAGAVDTQVAELFADWPSGHYSVCLPPGTACAKRLGVRLADPLLTLEPLKGLVVLDEVLLSFKNQQSSGDANAQHTKE